MLLNKLQQDFPSLRFDTAKFFFWSPRKQVIYYNSAKIKDARGIWSILHEVSHAILGHRDFRSDFDLLQMEIAAWQKAKELAASYSVSIDEDHIQECLDTYRDWLYQRSSCPRCMASGLQHDRYTYQCINCDSTWHVSQSRLCRPYRRKHKEPSAV